MGILIQILQLILSLSILVILHELGHFIPAKLFKTRVEKFYLFFNPWFSIFKHKRGETEYGIGWLPLGGYVKISGMIDESMDKEAMKLPPQPYEFRSKPAWQRLIIMIGGVTVNALLAVAIYIGVLFVWGDQYLPTNEAKYGITTDALSSKLGLINGDKILSVDNQLIEDFQDIPKTILLDEAKTIQIQRDSVKMDLPIPDGFSNKMMKHNSRTFIGVRFPFVVGKVTKNSNALKAGLQENDRIIGVKDSSVQFFDEIYALFETYKNQTVNLKILRGNDTLNLPVAISGEATIGVQLMSMDKLFNVKVHEYNFIQAIPAGFLMTFKQMSNYMKSLKLLINPESQAYKHLGGFITIGSLFATEWHWESFWAMTAFLSLILAIMNLLPIPALDGGHVLFLLFEIITRRKPSEKFLEYAQIVGMVILLGLLVLANGNDILRLFQR